MLIVDLISFSNLFFISGFSFKNFCEFSRPCPILSPEYEYQAPAFSTNPNSTPRSISSPNLEIPLPKIISTSAQSQPDLRKVMAACVYPVR